MFGKRKYKKVESVRFSLFNSFNLKENVLEKSLACKINQKKTWSISCITSIKPDNRPATKFYDLKVNKTMGANLQVDHKPSHKTFKLSMLNINISGGIKW